MALVMLCAPELVHLARRDLARPALARASRALLTLCAPELVHLARRDLAIPAGTRSSESDGASPLVVVRHAVSYHLLATVRAPGAS
jgi:hypothetical protein